MLGVSKAKAEHLGLVEIGSVGCERVCPEMKMNVESGAVGAHGTGDVARACTHDNRRCTFSVL